MSKYVMSFCGRFKEPINANLSPAIQDKDWRLVREILKNEAKTELFKQQMIEFNKHLIAAIVKKHLRKRPQK